MHATPSAGAAAIAAGLRGVLRVRFTQDVLRAGGLLDRDLGRALDATQRAAAATAASAVRLLRIETTGGILDVLA
jgi:hypothetical protein